MPIPKPPRRLAWLYTLKFKIVAMAVLAALASAGITARLVLAATELHMREVLLEGERDDAESTAAILSTKVDMLKDALKAAARQAPVTLWSDPSAMGRHLKANAALGSLFEGVIAAAPDGTMMARLSRGKLSTNLPFIGDRAYFQHALQTDQPVISEPLTAKSVNIPVVVIAVAALSPDGRPVGILAGVLALSSNNLFSDQTGATRQQGVRVLVMNREGALLAHPDQNRLLEQAESEPGLADVVGIWRGSGSPIDTVGTATLTQGHLVAVAGIADTDWTLARVTPTSVAFAAVSAARQVAWRAAIAVAALVAFSAGAIAYWLTRPISKLKARAHLLLREGEGAAGPWPHDKGEVGSLARTFHRVVAQRGEKHAQTQALLRQFQAVLDHAEAGIAFTRNGNFELVNIRFCEVFGVTKAEVLGCSTKSIHPSEEAYQTLSEQAHPSFLETGSFEGEFQLTRRNGELFWARMRGRAVVPGDRSEGTIWTFEDITESRDDREKLTYASSHDALTGLLNRAAFDALLERTTAQAAEAPFCAMFVDLDRFKQVNDTGGHAAGDALLRDISKELTAQVRQADSVARLGGDEFAILLAGCPLRQAIEVGEKVRQAVQRYELTWNGRRFSVAASIGLVAVNGEFHNAADVLIAADTACYEAKQKGRNTVAVFKRESSSVRRATAGEQLLS